MADAEFTEENFEANRTNEEEERANKSPLPTGFSSVTSPQPLRFARRQGSTFCQEIADMVSSEGDSDMLQVRAYPVSNGFRPQRLTFPRAHDLSMVRPPFVRES